MIRTASQISTASVTDAQIGACHKCFSGSIPFYMVQSSRDELVEYKVTWDAEHGFRCTCKSGQNGFANCKAGVCKHVIWSVAAAREEREAVAELERAVAEQVVAKPVVPTTYTTVDLETRARIEAANERAAAKPVSRAKANSPKGFSLLRV